MFWACDHKPTADQRKPGRYRIGRGQVGLAWKLTPTRIAYVRYSLSTLMILLFLGPPVLFTVIATIDAARVCKANARPFYRDESKPDTYPLIHLVTPRIIIVEEEESLL